MYVKVFRVVLNKIGKFRCVVEQTQNYRFSRFSVILLGSNATDVENMAIIRHQKLKINTKRCFVFCFKQILILTVIFAILVGHIELKILTENADLQSQTLS